MKNIKSYLVPLVIAITLSSFKSTSAVIRPSSELSVTNGQGFVVYLEVGKSFGNISHCWFNFQGQGRLEVDLSASQPIVTVRGEQIFPFSKKICGIRVNNISAASMGIWKLEVENLHEEFDEGELKLNILTAPMTLFDTKLTRALGKGTISCTKQEYTRYCKLFNPLTGDTWNQCDLQTTIHNGSNYECHTMSWGSMGESIEMITVVATTSTEYSDASIEETDDHYVLRCTMKSTSLHACRAEMPDRKTQLYIMEGLSNGRYNSYDTLSSQSKCALEIPKPLEQHENGLWKIQHSDASQLTGCLFYVGPQSKETIIEEELNRQQKQYNGADGSRNHNEKATPTMLAAFERKIELYSTEDTISEITCNVPFVVDDCYLRDPRNTVHFPESVKFERSRALGICTFISLPSVPGIWSCGLRGSDYKDDVVQEIEVVVESPSGRTLTDNIRAYRRDSLELMCKSPFDEPISKCVYVDPLNQVHLLASAASGPKTTGRVQYFGKGIEMGFCGMRIEVVDVDDFGDWSCQFLSYVNPGKVSNFTMTVSESVLSHASAYGLGFGLPAAVLMLSVASFVAYKRRRRAIAMGPTSTESINMNDGE